MNCERWGSQEMKNKVRKSFATNPFFIQTILKEPNDDETINLKLVNAKGRAQGSDLELEWMMERV